MVRRTDSGENSFSAALNSGELGQIEILDHLARQIARQDELDLARHGLGVDRAAVDHGLVDLGPQKDIFAAFDEDARFGLVARRHQVDGDKGRRRDDQRRPDDRALFCARSRGRSRRGSFPRRPKPPDRCIGPHHACELRTRRLGRHSASCNVGHLWLLPR